MTTPWQPPPKTSQANHSKASNGVNSNQEPTANASFSSNLHSSPQNGTASKGHTGPSVTNVREGAPPPRVKPFKCSECYEKTVGWDAMNLTQPKIDSTQLRLSQQVQVSSALSMLHTLFLRNGYMRDQTWIPFCAYEAMVRYDTPNFLLFCKGTSKGNLATTLERNLGQSGLRFILGLNFYLQERAVWGKSYLQYKTDKFCTRVGMATNGLKPSMYTLSHLHGITRSLALGGKVSILHKDRRIACAGSVQFDSGAGLFSGTVTSAKKVIATCTRHIAHPLTPDSDNVVIAAQIKCSPTKLENTTAAIGYKLRFPMSNSIMRGSVDSLCQLSCIMENDLEFLAVRSFFSSTLNFLTHKYRFGLGFTMGGGEQISQPRKDNNPLLGHFQN